MSEFCLPPLETHLQLTEDWTFDLYPEGRNFSLFKQVSPEDITDSKYGGKTYKGTYRDDDDNPDRTEVEIYLPSGSVLMIDRVYVRQGKKKYSSITFQLKKTPRDDVDVEDAKGKSHVRFWVRLKDANKIKFQEVEVDEYEEPEIEFPSVLTRRPWKEEGVVKVDGEPKFRVEYRKKEVEKTRMERVLTSKTDEYEELDEFVDKHREDILEDVEKLENTGNFGLGGDIIPKSFRMMTSADKISGTEVEAVYLRDFLNIVVGFGGTDEMFRGLPDFKTLDDPDIEFNVLDEVNDYFKIERKEVPVETHEGVWDLYDCETDELIYEAYTRHDSCKSRIKKEVKK